MRSSSAGLPRLSVAGGGARKGWAWTRKGRRIAWREFWRGLSWCADLKRTIACRVTSRAASLYLHPLGQVGYYPPPSAEETAVINGAGPSRLAADQRAAARQMAEHEAAREAAGVQLVDGKKGCWHCGKLPAQAADGEGALRKCSGCRVVRSAVEGAACPHCFSRVLPAAADVVKSCVFCALLTGVPCCRLCVCCRPSTAGRAACARRGAQGTKLSARSFRRKRRRPGQQVVGVEVARSRGCSPGPGFGLLRWWWSEHNAEWFDQRTGSTPTCCVQIIIRSVACITESPASEIVARSLANAAARPCFSRQSTFVRTSLVAHTSRPEA